MGKKTREKKGFTLIHVLDDVSLSKAMFHYSNKTKLNDSKWRMTNGREIKFKRGVKSPPQKQIT